MILNGKVCVCVCKWHVRVREQGAADSTARVISLPHVCQLHPLTLTPRINLTTLGLIHHPVHLEFKVLSSSKREHFKILLEASK